MRRILILPLLALAVTALPLSATSSDIEFVQVLQVDDYQKMVDPGDVTTYNWTLRHVDTGTALTIVVQTSMSGRGWTASAAPESLVLAPGGLGGVTATVVAPLEGGSSSSNMTVTFYVYQDGYLVQVTSTYVITSVESGIKSGDRVLGLFNNPLPHPLDNEWGVFLLDVVIWLAIALAVVYAMDGIAIVYTKKTTTMMDDIILSILRTPLLILIFAFGVVQSLDALYAHIPEGIRSIVFAAYRVVVVFVIFYLVYKMFKEILLYYGKMVAKRTASKIDDVIVPVVEKVGVVVIALAALGYALGALNVDLTVFIAGGVVVSMVLAFAAQETISNFFSGVFLLLDRPFAEGDTIILTDGDWCEVRRIGLRTTRLYRFTDATIVSIPNNKLVNDKIVRMSNVSDPARVMTKVSVAYGTDPTKAREAIKKAIKASPYSLLDDPKREPMILFDEMAETGLVFNVIVWINDRTKRILARDRLVEEIYRKLNEAGIEIPLPQRVVHLRETDRKR
jgi:small-conductance mechanosensitive channel